jgi:hypothetical protein
MRNALLLGAALFGAAMPANAAYITVHVERSAANQAQIAPDAFVESFDAAAPGFTSNFGGSAVKGVFSGFSFNGGASALGAGQADVKLDRKVKYFGFRTDQLDGNNTVELLSGGKSLGTFNLVGSPQQAGFEGPSAESGYTYVNFFSDTAFDQVRFVQSAGNATFDDVSVGQVTAVPELTTWTMLILGFGAAGVALRRARRVKGVRFA